MGKIIAQIDMNSRNETCLNMLKTTIAPTPNYHTNQLKYAKILPFIYAQTMATHSCLQNGCSFGFSVFPRQKRRQQSLKALPSPWNGAASSGA